MQYLIQISDEFRESYAKVDGRIDEIQDEMQILKMKLDTIEFNTHPNRQPDYGENDTE